MVKCMHPLKSTYLREMWWPREMLSKYPAVVGRRAGQETLSAMVQFCKNTCQLCVEMYQSVTSDYLRELETHRIFYFFILYNICQILCPEDVRSQNVF